MVIMSSCAVEPAPDQIVMCHRLKSHQVHMKGSVPKSSHGPWILP